MENLKKLTKEIAIKEVTDIRNLKLTTTLDRAITQNPCYVPFISER